MTKYIAPNGYPSEVLCTHSLTGNCAYNPCSKYHPNTNEEAFIAGIEYKYKRVYTLCTNPECKDYDACENLHLNNAIDSNLSIEDIITPEETRLMMINYNNLVYKYVTSDDPREHDYDTIVKFGQEIRKLIAMLKPKTRTKQPAASSVSDPDHLANLLDKAMTKQ
jgi:hypothetical protein